MAAYHTLISTITGVDANGILVDLRIQDLPYMSPDYALQIYTWISLIFIALWAGFATNTNEGKFAFTTPLMAAVFVYFGWLRAPDPVSYWGSIVFCMLLGVFLVLNEGYHRGVAIMPGNKALTAALMIMAFSVCYGFVLSGNILPITTQYGVAANNATCGYGLTCLSDGSIDFDSSITTVKSGGGLISDVTNTFDVTTAMISSIITLATVLGSVILFAGVLVAAYPVIMTSPQALALLTVMQLVIWAIYLQAFFNIFGKPTGSGEGYV